MTLPASGPLSIQQINAEFGRGNDLNSYRGTTWYTDAGGSGTFSTGAISISDFYGKRATSPTFTATISSHYDQLNLRSWAISAGWNGSSAAIITLAGGYWIYSSNTGVAALTIDGSWPGGVTFINNSYVMGMGGNGGNGSNAVGFAGGTGLAVSTYVTIQNNANIGGGGGGGGGGGAGFGSAYQPLTGGGGGGGRTGLANSSGGSGYNAGGAGTSGGEGGGGNGQPLDATHYAGRGGNGGSWGATAAAGSPGTYYYGGAYSPSNGGAGGAGGLAVSGNWLITWSATGNRYGGLG